MAWGELATAKGRLVRDVLYSVDSGLVTTVSFLAGISLSLAGRDALLAAVAIQVVAGTLAIFFSACSSTRAQKLFYESQIERERREIEEDPRKETAEIRVIFRELGFSRAEQNLAVRRISADRDRWLRFMVQEEIGISPSSIDNPWEIGLVSAGAFLLGALPAVLPFLVLPSVATALPVRGCGVRVPVRHRDRVDAGHEGPLAFRRPRNPVVRRTRVRRGIPARPRGPALPGLKRILPPRSHFVSRTIKRG